jgi:hypothetical protein
LSTYKHKERWGDQYRGKQREREREREEKIKTLKMRGESIRVNETEINETCRRKTRLSTFF